MNDNDDFPGYEPDEAGKTDWRSALVAGVVLAAIVVAGLFTAGVL